MQWHTQKMAFSGTQALLGHRAGKVHLSVGEHVDRSKVQWIQGSIDSRFDGSKVLWIQGSIDPPTLTNTKPIPNPNLTQIHHPWVHQPLDLLTLGSIEPWIH